MRIIRFCLLSFFTLTLTLSTYSQKEVCVIINSFVDLNSMVSSSNYRIDKFNLKLEEDDDELVRVVHHKESGVQISAGIRITSEIYSDRIKKIQMKLSFTGEEEEGFDILDGTQAETVYDKKWKWMSVSDSIKIDKRRYYFDLICGKKKYFYESNLDR